MARKSPPHSDLILISTWPQADEVLKSIGSLQMKVNALESEATDKINEIKDELSDQTDPMLKDIARMVTSLQAYCENHKDDFDSARSRKLQFGTVGWRASTSITVGQKCIEKLREVFGRKKAFEFLRIKVEVNKEALEKLDDAKLKEVGARRNYKDPFFAEPDIHESTDY